MCVKIKKNNSFNQSLNLKNFYKNNSIYIYGCKINFRTKKQTQKMSLFQLKYNK